MSGLATPLALAAGEMVGGPGHFRGITMHVTGAAAAKVRLWDNASAASGTILGTWELTASGADSFVDLMYTPGRQFVRGLFLELVSGTVEGSVFI
jgi:hypothetical protein